MTITMTAKGAHRQGPLCENPIGKGNFDYNAHDNESQNLSKGGVSPLSEMIDDMMAREPREHKRYKARFRSEARNGFPSLNISRFS
jgi:hypothetical protein